MSSEIQALLTDINQLRIDVSATPLALDAGLQRAAQRHVEAGAPDTHPPLDRLTREGCFARFALSHTEQGTSVEESLALLLKKPLSRGKFLHPGITHMGVGIRRTDGGILIVVDLARLVASVDISAQQRRIEEEILARRQRNRIDPAVVDPQLTALAGSLAVDYMSQKGTSDALIQELQASFAQSRFALGRVIVVFQVMRSVEELTVPERITDPAIDAIGAGLAQGNHPDHEPGAVAMALLLARPQTGSTAGREDSRLPRARAMPTSAPKKQYTNPEEQAWVFTLTGNHKGAARQFLDAWKRTRNPRMLYEAARAHARGRDFKEAERVMRDYAAQVEGEDRNRAEEMIARLQTGQSIFNESESEVMSVEARRFFIIGQNLFNNGEFEGAIDAFQQAYSYAPHPDLLFNIGLAHLKAGNIGDALDFFSEYQRLVPEARNVDEARQLFELGVQLYGAGQFESAIRSFTMAFGLLPIPELLYNLALCHRAMGEDREALRILKELYDTTTDTETRKDIRQLIDEIEQQKGQ